jgi:predicted RNA-binding protein YlqC (UPF0109 family)
MLKEGCMASTAARVAAEVDLKQMLLLIVQSLVDRPDQVYINEIRTLQNIIYQAKVATGEVSKVIGKQGRIVNSIRMILRSSSAKMRLMITFEVSDQ